jgi:PAS domain S-box-containing protein
MSLEQYHRVVEEADEGFWIIDSEAVILYVNRSLARMLGSDPEDVLGRSAYEFLFDEDREAGGRAFAEYLGKREGHEREHRYRRRDGTELWARVSLHSLLAADGSPEAVVGMFTDVTERRRVETELEEVRCRLQGMFDHAPVGQALFEGGSPYRVLSHNRIYQELLDEPFRSRGVVGCGVAEYLPNADACGVLGVFRDVIATGGVADPAGVSP